MKVDKKSIGLFSILMLISSFVFSDITATHNSKLEISEGDKDMRFGHVVVASADGNSVLIGAYEDEDTGSAYLYTKDGDNWVQEQIKASDGQADDYFGYSVGISGDGSVLAIGATGTKQGTVYVYQKNGEEWKETILQAFDKKKNDEYGSAVAVSEDGNRIVVGAVGDDRDQGAIYIYDLIEGDWIEEKVVGSDSMPGDLFGISLDMTPEGNTIVVGAEGESEDYIMAGAAYVYQWAEGQWNELKITPEDQTNFTLFGHSVAISDDGMNIVVGMIADSTKDYYNGAAYTFGYNEESKIWLQDEKIIPSDAKRSEYFGNSVDISDDGSEVVIGCYKDNAKGKEAGAVYFYEKDYEYSEMKQVAKDAGKFQYYGSSVSLSASGLLAVGSYGDVSVYLYDVEVTMPEEEVEEETEVVAEEETEAEGEEVNARSSAPSVNIGQLFQIQKALDTAMSSAVTTKDSMISATNVKMVMVNPEETVTYTYSYILEDDIPLEGEGDYVFDNYSSGMVTIDGTLDQDITYNGFLTDYIYDYKGVLTVSFRDDTFDIKYDYSYAFDGNKITYSGNLYIGEQEYEYTQTGTLKVASTTSLGN